MQSTTIRKRVSGIIVSALLLMFLGTATASWAVTPQISAGGGHTLTLRSDGTLWASGSNQSGQLGDGGVLNQSTAVQIGNGGWRSVSAGLDHSLAVKADGTLWSWGSNTFGQLGLPKVGIPPNDSFAGDRLSPVQIGTSANWIAVEAAGFSSFALQADGSLWVWGDNSTGQLGEGSLTPRAEPFKLPPPTDTLGNPSNGFFTAIASSGEHTLALQADGTLWAAGFNLHGQLGDGSLLDRTTLVKIGSDNNWTVIAAGEIHSAAIKADGTLWTWGNNTQGQLGNGAVLPGADVTIPTKIIGAITDSQWSALSAGDLYTIALKRNGSLWSWGSNTNGQLGVSSTINRSVPTNIIAPAGVTTGMSAIAAGSAHSLAFKANGDLYAWGNNVQGQFGNGSTVSSLIAVPVSKNSVSWVSIEPGRLFTAAIRSNGTLWSWGSNATGQLGNGTLLSSSTPGQVGTSTNWRSVAGGTNHAIGLSADGSLWSWGNDATGQLGDGVASANVTTPRNLLVSTLVDPQLSDDDWASISAGTGHNAALKADGSLWTWGDNTSGQLGMFNPLTTSTTNIPGRVTVASGVPAAFNNGWVGIAAGGSHTLALQADGSLWSWGSNFSGEAGINTLTGTSFFTAQPVVFALPPAGGSPTFNNSWTKIAAGFNFSVGIQADGSLWAWGANNFNQLGNNTGVSSFTPIRINLPSPAVSVITGQSHTLAFLSDGTIWAWGRNDSGQLGINTTATPVSPRQLTLSSPAGQTNDWSTAGAGGLHSIFLKNDGTLWSSGTNSSGQAGLGLTAAVQIPTKLLEGSSTISPASLAFGNGFIGIAPSPTRTILISNTGTTALTATINSNNPADFSVIPAVCSNIAPAASCIVTITFTPALPVGAKSAILSISSNDPVTPLTLVNVSGTAVNPFTINASSSAGGSITPAGQVPVIAGGSQTFIFTPDLGFSLQDVVVNGISQGAAGSYTFSNIQGPQTIVANFVAGVTINVSATAGTGGTISPNGVFTINRGDNKTFIITPDFGFAISDVVVTEMVENLDINGSGLGTFSPVTTSLGPVNNFTFFNVTVAGSSISASFAATNIRTWNWRNPLPHGVTTRHAETDGAGSYAAVGDFGIIMTSANGIDWSVRQSGTLHLNGVAFGAGRFVAVGNGGRILRSSTKAADGYASWNEMSSGTASPLNGIIYNGTVFVAVGNSQISENFPFVPKMTILTSPDGVTWTDHSPLLALNETLDLRDVTSGNGKLVAVGSGGTIFTSLDNGANWTRIPDDLNGRGSNINSITFGSNTFVAVGDFAQVTTSTDNGITWNPVTIVNVFSDLKGVAFGSLTDAVNIFVAVGTDGDIITSENLGANWSNQVSGLANNGSGAVLHAVVFGSTTLAIPQLLIAGEYGALLTSADSLSWSNRQKSAITAVLKGVARGNATFVAVGGNPPTINGPASASIVSSLDNGLTWTARTVPAGSQNLTSAAYGNGIFVAVGASAFNPANPSARATILTSPNGTTWTNRSSDSFLGINAITFANGRFIAVGDYNPSGNDRPEGAAILTSTNGISWTFSQIITPNGTPLNGISYNGATYVAVGELGSVVTSTNGIEWTDRGADTIINGYDLSSIAFGSGVFRTVGLTTEVGVGPSSFVSFNGANWTPEVLPVPTTLNNRFHSIAFFNNQFVAVGNDNFILSKDTATAGSKWVINTGAEFINSSLYGIAVGNGSYVAVGMNGTILQSNVQVAGLPEIEVHPEELSFAPLQAGLTDSRTITINNDGVGTLTLGTLLVPAGPFSLNNDLCSGAALAPAASCTVDAVFAPQVDGATQANLSIPSDDPDTPDLTVPLSGTATPGFTLTVNIAGTASGSVMAAPAGIPALNCSSGSCPSVYPNGAVVTLVAAPADWTATAVFSGDCIGTGSCQTTMTTNKNATATFSIVNRVQLSAGTPLDHPGIQGAYEAAAASSEIKARTYLFPEMLLFNQGKDVTLSGGWDTLYAAPSDIDSFTTVQGKLEVRSGSLRVKNIRIR